MVLRRTEASVKKFNREVNNFAKTLDSKHFRPFLQKLGIEALGGIVRMTPVDTGRARGNWQVAINHSITNEVNRLDANGGSTITQGVNVIRGQLPSKAVGQAIHITNNVPYIEELESGTQSSQAPRGMVAVTLARLALMFARVR